MMHKGTFPRAASGNVPLCIIARKRFARKRSARYRTSSVRYAPPPPRAVGPLSLSLSFILLYYCYRNVSDYTCKCMTLIMSDSAVITTHFFRFVSTYFGAQADSSRSHSNTVYISLSVCLSVWSNGTDTRVPHNVFLVIIIKFKKLISLKHTC